MKDYKALFSSAPGKTNKQKLAHVVEQNLIEWDIADFNTEVLATLNSPLTTAEDIIDTLEAISLSIDRGENPNFKKAFFALKGIITRNPTQLGKKANLDADDDSDDDISDDPADNSEDEDFEE